MTCVICGKPLKGRQRKYCGRYCHGRYFNKGYKKVDYALRPCARDDCKKKFKPSRRNHVYCSKSCTNNDKNGSDFLVPAKRLPERSVIKSGRLVKACGDCPFQSHCREAVKIGLWVACENADEGDMLRLQAIGDKERAQKLLNFRVNFQAS